MQMEQPNLVDFVESTSQGICVHDNGKPLYVNSSFAKAFGYTVREFMNLKNIDDIIHPDDLQRLRRYRKARITGQEAPKRYEYHGVTKKGKDVWFDCEASIITWNNQEAIQIVQHDITKQKEMEESLREEIYDKEEMLSAISDNIEIGLWRIDETGTLVYSNPAFFEIYERSKEEINADFYSFVHEQDKEKCIEHCENGKLGKKGSFEMRIRKPNNNIKWVRITYTPLQTGGVVGTVTDITKEKNVLPKLVELRDELKREKEYMNKY